MMETPDNPARLNMFSLDLCGRPAENGVDASAMATASANKSLSKNKI